MDFLAAAFFFAGAADPSSTPRPSLGARDGLSTASLKPLSAVMRARLDALIRICSPVAGLRPMRAARSTLANLANPEIDTGSPLDTAAVTTSVKPRRAESMLFVSWPVSAATARTRSLRFILASFVLSARPFCDIWREKARIVLQRGWDQSSTGCPTSTRPPRVTRARTPRSAECAALRWRMMSSSRGRPPGCGRVVITQRPHGRSTSSST